MKILACVVSVPRVPTIDAFESTWALSVLSSAFSIFAGQLLFGISLPPGPTSIVIAAFTSFLPQPCPNPLGYF